MGAGEGCLTHPQSSYCTLGPLLCLPTSPEKGLTEGETGRQVITPGPPLRSPDAPFIASPSIRQQRQLLSAHFSDREN